MMMLFCGDKRKKLLLLLRDIHSIYDDDDDDEDFIIGVKNARVSFSFALHILCIHIYIHTLRMHTGTIGISIKWLCNLCFLRAPRYVPINASKATGFGFLLLLVC